MSGGTPPTAVQALVQSAVARLQKVFVQAPVPRPAVFAANECYPGQPAMNEVVPGVVIWVDIRTIDGPGGNLGSANWCLRRMPSLVTTVGFLRLDIDDLAIGLTDGTAYGTVVHEMLHVLGFGSYWGDVGLLSGTASNDPWFNGAFARNAFNQAGGLSYFGAKVPVENVGGAGTRLSHWRTSLMASEMMTGYSCGGVAPLSFITTESFADMGIPVTLYGDDDFTIRFQDCPASRQARAQETVLETNQRYIDERTGQVLTEREARLLYPQPLRLGNRSRPAVPQEVISAQRRP